METVLYINMLPYAVPVPILETYLSYTRLC